MLNKKFSDFRPIFVKWVVKIPFSASRGIFWVWRKHEHVHTELANSGEKNLTWRMIFLSYYILQRKILRNKKQ